MIHKKSERRTELDNFDILEEKAERAALIENKALVKVLLDIQRQHRDEMQDVREAAIVADRALQMAKKREHRLFPSAALQPVLWHWPRWF